MVALLDLPDEILVQIFCNLPAVELNSVAVVCRKFRDFASMEEIWKWFCLRDFKANGSHLWAGWTYRDFYTRALYKYSFVFGLWRRQLDQYGGLLIVKMEADGIVGYDCFPPLDDSLVTVRQLNGHIQILDSSDYSRQSLNHLRFQRSFIVQPDNDSPNMVVVKAYSVFTMHDQASEQDITLHKDSNGFSYTSPFLELVDVERIFQLEFGIRRAHPPPAPDDDDDDNDALMALVSASGLLGPRFRKYGASVGGARTYRPLHLQRSIPSSSRVPCIQPGLYSGTYGGHGWEILSFRYVDDGNQVLDGVKVTGDPNIPAEKLSVRVFLSKPLAVVAEDWATFDGVKEAIRRNEAQWPANGAPTDMPAVTGVQPFGIPNDCIVRRPRSEIPRFCRWVFMAEGQVANDGYIHPQLIPCLFIGFDEEYFGVLWLRLESLSLYYRVKNL